MMKTIYSKFNSERSPKFQIETRISMDDNGNKLISKIALCDEAMHHIKNMSIYYNSLQSGKDLLVPCSLENSRIDFKFIKGTSFMERLLDCAERNDRVTFFDYLQEYNRILKKLIEKSEMFVISNDFIEVFGTFDMPSLLAAKNLNVDLIFENMIFVNNSNDSIQIIDYEWFFPFAIPINFVIWRAIYGLYAKNITILNEFVKDTTVYDMFDITEEEITVFKHMDHNFLEYIYGKELNYETILKNYESPKIDVIQKLPDIAGRQKGYSQIFIDDGNGYSDEMCKTIDHIYRNGEEITISLNLKSYDNIVHIRFDPLPFQGIIMLKKCYFLDDEEKEYDIEKFLQNASLFFSELYMFETDDPQFIITDKVENNYKSIHFVFEYFQYNVSNKRLLTEAIESNKTDIHYLSETLEEVKNELKAEQNYAAKLLLNKQELEKELMKNMEFFKNIENFSI